MSFYKTITFLCLIPMFYTTPWPCNSDQSFATTDCGFLDLNNILHQEVIVFYMRATEDTNNPFQLVEEANDYILKSSNLEIGFILFDISDTEISDTERDTINTASENKCVPLLKFLQDKGIVRSTGIKEINIKQKATRVIYEKGIPSNKYTIAIQLDMSEFELEHVYLNFTVLIDNGSKLYTLDEVFGNIYLDTENTQQSFYDRNKGDKFEEADYLRKFIEIENGTITQKDTEDHELNTFAIVCLGLLFVCVVVCLLYCRKRWKEAGIKKVRKLRRLGK